MRGAEALTETARDYGADVVAAYMGHVLANAEDRSDGSWTDDGEFAYEMDNGACVRVKITIDKKARSATFDFTGTSDQLPDNFNAPYSIARAASLYVVRTLIDDVIPMNDGCLRPIRSSFRWFDAQPRFPGGGRRRKCRDQPSRHRCLVRRHRPHQQSGDDEQFHLRQ